MSSAYIKLAHNQPTDFCVFTVADPIIHQVNIIIRVDIVRYTCHNIIIIQPSVTVRYWMAYLSHVFRLAGLDELQSWTRHSSVSPFRTFIVKYRSLIIWVETKTGESAKVRDKKRLESVCDDTIGFSGSTLSLELRDSFDFSLFSPAHTTEFTYFILFCFFFSFKNNSLEWGGGG